MVFFFSVLGTEAKALCMLARLSTTKFYPQIYFLGQK